MNRVVRDGGQQAREDGPRARQGGERRAVFVLDGDDLIGERIYHDTTTFLRQLGVASDPLSLTGRLQTLVGHPWTIGRGVVCRVIGRLQ